VTRFPEGLSGLSVKKIHTFTVVSDERIADNDLESFG
jgi:hypothetical protein